jgi:hypothetical protein
MLPTLPPLSNLTKFAFLTIFGPIQKNLTFSLLLKVLYQPEAFKTIPDHQTEMSQPNSFFAKPTLALLATAEKPAIYQLKPNLSIKDF